MSSKGTSAMGEKNKEKSALVPRLRFPKFRNAGTWELKPLGRIARILDEKAGNKKLVLLSITSGVGLVSQVEKFGREIAGAQYKNYYVIQHDDFAYNKSSTKDYPEGFVARYQGNEIGAVPNSIFTCFRISPGTAYPPCLGYLFANNLHGRWLRRFVTVGARAHGSLNVDDKDLLATPVPLPPKAILLDEQKKIADCLSSLDELITAETQELDAIKTYKKGLMQRLFPREGETAPRLRFPKFRDTGEWKMRPFGDLLDDVIDFRGRTPTKLGMEWGGGTIPALSSNNVKNGFIDYGAECYLGSEDLYMRWMGEVNLQEDDIVFTMEAPLGNALLLPDSRKYILSQRVVAFKTKADVLNPFLVQIIWGDGFQSELGKLATGSTAKGINQKSLRTIPVRLPDTDEQQEIADCLSPLDDLITAQSQKIDALKTHKKGLMQQLFPVLDEVPA